MLTCRARQGRIIIKRMPGQSAFRVAALPITARHACNCNALSTCHSAPPMQGNTLQRKGGRSRGRQVYLGGWNSERYAAMAFDLAAIKYWGPTTELNVSQSFSVACYCLHTCCNGLNGASVLLSMSKNLPLFHFGSIN